jgi:hypothetical protein
MFSQCSVQEMLRMGNSLLIPQSTFHARHVKGRWQQLLQVPAFKQDGEWLIFCAVSRTVMKWELKQSPTVSFGNYHCPPNVATCFLKLSILVARGLYTRICVPCCHVARPHFSCTCSQTVQQSWSENAATSQICGFIFWSNNQSINQSILAES